MCTLHPIYLNTLSLVLCIYAIISKNDHTLSMHMNVYAIYSNSRNISFCSLWFHTYVDCFFSTVFFSFHRFSLFNKFLFISKVFNSYLYGVHNIKAVSEHGVVRVYLKICAFFYREIHAILKHVKREIVFLLSSSWCFSSSIQSKVSSCVLCVPFFGFYFVSSFFYSFFNIAIIIYVYTV